MRFCDLLDLPYNSRTGVVDISALTQALPHMPESVLRQVLSEHGRKENFQKQYGTINLQTVTWRLLTLTAAELTRASVNRAFENWVNAVSARLSRFEQSGWPCIDVRSDVVSHWKDKRTWSEPPVLLQNVKMLGPLHLMEGHTRLGTLRGALQHGLIAVESRHSAWVGS